MTPSVRDFRSFYSSYLLPKRMFCDHSSKSLPFPKPHGAGKIATMRDRAIQQIKKTEFQLSKGILPPIPGLVYQI